MATPVIMPKQGQSVETCIITRWLKSKGDPVQAGDLLFSYETDKAAFEAEAIAGGTLLEIFYGEGDEVAVLSNVAVIGSPGESIEPFRPGTMQVLSVEENAEKRMSEQSPVPGSHLQESTGTGSGIRISPRARRLAEEKQVDYKRIRGSGPNGRIIVRDIESITADLSDAGLEPPMDYTEEPVSNVRRLIANSMHHSLQTAAQLTHHMSADARNLLEARRKIKTSMEADPAFPDITLNDMVCFCVIQALLKMPGINMHFLGEHTRRFQKVHLGIAVDTNRGLMVPVVRNASDHSLTELSGRLKTVAESCRKGNISPELIKADAASFTVSNLGSYGVEMFTPVINLPQVAILGVCTITHRPADVGNGVMAFVPFMGLSLTYDHRAVDGGPATLFLKEIREQIEGFRSGFA